MAATPALAAAVPTVSQAGRQPLRSLLAYGVFGMPLAMAALPLYVHLPRFYGEHLGVGLAALGALLLVLRVADGVLDPLLGAWSDRGPSRRTLIALSVPVLALGMIALFSPPVAGEGPLLAGSACRSRSSTSRSVSRRSTIARGARNCRRTRWSARASRRCAKAWHSWAW